MALWELTGYLPVFAIMGVFFAWAHFRLTWKGQKPVKEKLLRAPGESLQVKIEELTEGFIFAVLILLVFGMALGGFTSIVMKHGGAIRQEVLIGSWAVALIGMILCSARILYVSRLLAGYRLGFSGERAVGEELNRLMLDGCIVFHDLVVDAWNIDHIVIAPSGVFAIETKTYRKKAKRQDDFYKVKFDGVTLHFPTRTDRRPLEQAIRNAGWLSDTLSKALAESIQVQPLLTLPGWWVERRGKGQAIVLNHREIRQCIVRKGPTVLSGKQMQQIAYQIEQRCRDVEF
jgi:hypothetical protein